MKYIVIRMRHKDVELEFPIIFPDGLVHSIVAGSVIAGLKAFHLKDAEYNTVAAGDFSSTAIGCECSGVSTSLGGVKSRGAVDDNLIQLNDYLHGIVT